MQSKTHNTVRWAGFSLVELLVVIAIIAVLAGMLLPVLSNAKNKGKVAKARTEMNDFKVAIQTYYNDYSRFPSSLEAVDATAPQVGAVPAVNSAGGAGCVDFTYGTYTNDLQNFRNGQPYTGILRDRSGNALPDIRNTYDGTVTPVGSYQCSNDELVSILMSLDRNRSGRPSRNEGFARNPRKNSYLNAKAATDNFSPGVGFDGVYRDPWGNPYIVTIDMNYDKRARDAYYRYFAMAGFANSPTNLAGLGGVSRSLTPGLVGAASGPTSMVFESSVDTMVWSFGIDGKVDSTVKADAGVNKDNIVTWQ